MTASLLCLSLASCGTGLSGLTSGSSSSSTGSSILGSILSAATSGETISGVLSSVLGTNKMDESSIVGTWTYSQPGCAFTSDNALANAGGEVAATTIKNKLKSQYEKIGVKSSNTKITLNNDGSFSATIMGKSWSGTYTFDESNQKLQLKGLLLNLTAYVKATSTGMAVLFEAQKLLTALQTVASVSGNSTLSTISDISKNYDGVRIGFDMKK